MSQRLRDALSLILKLIDAYDKSPNPIGTLESLKISLFDLCSIPTETLPQGIHFTIFKLGGILSTMLVDGTDLEIAFKSCRHQLREITVTLYNKIGGNVRDNQQYIPN